MEASEYFQQLVDRTVALVVDDVGGRCDGSLTRFSGDSV
jgi:hypothetical protein